MSGPQCFSGQISLSILLEGSPCTESQLLHIPESCGGAANDCRSSLAYSTPLVSGSRLFPPPSTVTAWKSSSRPTAFPDRFKKKPQAAGHGTLKTPIDRWFMEETWHRCLIIRRSGTSAYEASDDLSSGVHPQEQTAAGQCTPSGGSCQLSLAHFRGILYDVLHAPAALHHSFGVMCWLIRTQMSSVR